ncbi:MAG: GxxExxY protein [Verrucomicrobia bacterium]|nr:GxxExxY protein [Verrucomicrobiota bacterium]
MNSSNNIFPLCDRVRTTAYALHRFLRHGHLEKVYENGLAHRLQKSGLQVAAQHRLTVRDEDGTELGDYFADLFVEHRLIVEIKACKSLVDENVAQLLGYLRSARIEHGLLINFGAPKLQIRKYALSDPSLAADLKIE